MGGPNRFTKPESASGPVEVGKSTIQVKYTLVRGEKSNEIVSEYFGGLRACIESYLKAPNKCTFRQVISTSASFKPALSFRRSQKKLRQ